ncbi:GD21411 [Drosophila simulans]|uniref:GD21411 n=1 Tax=Drosophila simulans TaxID=7240 RepID=B4QZG3_DROSI|nr:GD21411 [Drosophila simulans]
MADNYGRCAAAGILSPPGPFLTPSPSPSISASPRLQPSPSLSPFPQDVVLVAGGSQVNANSNPQEHERKAATPGRRQSIHQFTNGSPNAGTVVFQPSPSQSPAAATTVIGVTSGGLIATAAGGTGAGLSTGVGAGSSSGVGIGVALHGNAIGNELNATLVGSNNIQLNKKGTKRATQQQQQQQQQLGHQIFSSAVAVGSKMF